MDPEELFFPSLDRPQAVLTQVPSRELRYQARGRWVGSYGWGCLPSAELNPNPAQKFILELDLKMEEGVRSKLILCFTVKTWQGPTEVFVEGRWSKTPKEMKVFLEGRKNKT